MKNLITHTLRFFPLIIFGTILLNLRDYKTDFNELDFILTAIIITLYFVSAIKIYLKN